ncbi:9421_t:CDS:1, partial [Diversispora eburnea]
MGRGNEAQIIMKEEEKQVSALKVWNVEEDVGNSGSGEDGEVE